MEHVKGTIKKCTFFHTHDYCKYYIIWFTMQYTIMELLYNDFSTLQDTCFKLESRDLMVSLPIKNNTLQYYYGIMYLYILQTKHSSSVFELEIYVI